MRTVTLFVVVVIRGVVGTCEDESAATVAAVAAAVAPDDCVVS